MEIVATPLYGGKKNIYELKEVVNGTPTVNKTTLCVQYTDEELIVTFCGAYDGAPYMPYSGDMELVWKGETVEAFLSPYGSEIEYMELDIAPNGASFFAKIYNPDGVVAYNRMFDETPIKVETTQKESGFEATMRIPISFLVKEGDVKSFKDLPWKGNFFRLDSHNEEYCALSPTGILNFHITKAFVSIRFDS